MKAVKTSQRCRRSRVPTAGAPGVTLARRHCPVGAAAGRINVALWQFVYHRRGHVPQPPGD
jgi:hypothetical protein